MVYVMSMMPTLLAALLVLMSHQSVTACDAGSVLVNGACTFCPPGTFALAAASSCTPCPSGYWSPINSVSAAACYPLAGTVPAPVATAPIQAPVAAPLKVSCDAGSVPVNGVCTFCPPGTFALAAASSCSRCPSGFWSPIDSVSPAACYPMARMSAEALCDAGSVPVNGVCTFCPPGTFALAAANSCTPCPTGFWSPIDSVSPAACYPLPSTVTAPVAAVPVTAPIAVVACAAGSVPVNGVCTFCPPGTFALAGASSCSHCPTGFWSPIDSVSADACYPLVKAAAKPVHDPVPAILCDAGSAPVNGVCTFCPVGTYALAAASSCTHCPTGYWAPINSVSADACYPLVVAATHGNLREEV
jgi:hypothetical protein